MSTTNEKKNVFLFDQAKGLSPKILGGKGYGLVQMVDLKLPVPPGFIISTEVCRDFFVNKTLSDAHKKEIKAALGDLEAEIGKPNVHVSVRSGAPVSMPGMMDTVLNHPLKDQAGLFDEIVNVFNSWFSPRAKEYRRIEKISEDLYTACVVQAMVSGKGKHSGTGVAFTRDPSTGERTLYGNWLPNAYGEELVSGTTNPLEISALQEESPKLYARLEAFGNILEVHFKDMLEIEFTIENGKLWLLQTRRAKREPAAARVVALDLHKEGVIDDVTLEQRLSSLPKIAPTFRFVNVKEDLKGTPAGGGTVSGVVALSCEAATKLALTQDVILVREETTPLDIVGIEASIGILTRIGGVTSHAAVVGRGLGRAVVVGAESLQIFMTKVVINGKEVPEGQPITIDGKTGRIWAGNVLAEKEKAA